MESPLHNALEGHLAARDGTAIWSAPTDLAQTHGVRHKPPVMRSHYALHGSRLNSGLLDNEFEQLLGLKCNKKMNLILRFTFY